MQHLAVKRERLHLAVGLHQDRAARGLVDAAGLHADETILDEVNAADAVLAAKLVECLQHAAGGKPLAVHGDSVALHKVDLDILGLVRRVLGGDGEFEHRLVRLRGRIEPRVLKDARLIGDVQEIAVHRIGLLERGLDGNPVLCAVGDHLGAAREQVAIGLDLPRRDDLELGCERHVGELEAALVVALARGTVRDGVGLFLLRDVHLCLGNERTGDRGAEVILALVNRVGPDHRVDEVAGEFLDEIEGVVFGSAGLQGLLVQALKLLFLTDISCKGDDLGVVSFLEPFDDDGGVEASRICEDDLHDRGRIVGSRQSGAK